MAGGTRIVQAGLEGCEIVVAYGKPAFEKSANWTVQVNIFLIMRKWVECVSLKSGRQQAGVLNPISRCLRGCRHYRSDDSGDSQVPENVDVLIPITHFVCPSSSVYLHLTQLMALAFASLSLLNYFSILYDPFSCIIAMF
jgi:hypothetical protein